MVKVLLPMLWIVGLILFILCIRDKKNIKISILFNIAVLIAILIATISNNEIEILDYGDNSNIEYESKIYYRNPEQGSVVKDGNAPEYFVNNEVLVFLAENREKRDLENYLDRYEVEIVGEAEIIGLYQLRFNEKFSYTELKALIRKLEKSKLIESAHINFVDELNSNGYIPNDSIFANTWDEEEDDLGNPKDSWYLQRINAPEVWEYRDVMSKIHVGIMDTDFGYTNNTNKDVKIQLGKVGKSVKNDETTYHGLGVASIIGAEFDNEYGICGVAPNTELYGVELGGTKTQYETINNQIFALVKLIFSDRCKVINASYGNEQRCIKASLGDKETISLIDAESELATSALKRLLKANEFVICTSAGNLGDKTFKKNKITGRYSILATAPSYGDKETIVGEHINIDAKFNNIFTYITDEEIEERIIVVGASGKKSDRAKISSDGDRIDIWAPGERIYIAYGDTFITDDGTSLAAPLVSGTAAILFGLDGRMSGAEVKKEILNGVAENKVLNVENALKNKIKDLENIKVVQDVKIKDRIVIAVDTSGSMDKHKLDNIKDALYLFVDSLEGTGSQLSLVSFSSQMKWIIPFTSDLDQIRDGIDRLKSGGGTKILESIRDINEYYVKETMGDSFYENTWYTDDITLDLDYTYLIISDGGNYDTSLEYRKRMDVNSFYRDLGVSTFVIGYPEDVESLEFLRLIADKGRYFESFEALNMIDILNIIRSELVSERYRIVYVECPVDVRMEYNGEVLDSSTGKLYSETSFGNMIVNPETGSKTFRLKEDITGEIEVTAYDSGTINIETYVESEEDPGYYEKYRWNYDLLVNKGESFKISVENIHVDRLDVLKDKRPLTLYIGILVSVVGVYGIIVCIKTKHIHRAIGMLSLTVVFWLAKVTQHYIDVEESFFRSYEEVWLTHLISYGIGIFALILLIVLIHKTSKKFRIISIALGIGVVLELGYKYTYLGPIITLSNVTNAYSKQDLDKVLENYSISKYCSPDPYEDISEYMKTITDGIYVVSDIDLILPGERLSDVLYEIKNIAKESDIDRRYRTFIQANIDDPVKLDINGYDLRWIKAAAEISAYVDGAELKFMMLLEQVGDYSAEWKLAYIN